MATQPLAEIGVIGGTGLYEIDALKNSKWITLKTPWGKPSDEFLVGEITGRQVAFLPRHGRHHHLLPSEINHRANIYAMKTLGVTRILSVSAVGSLKDELTPGTFVTPSQFFDRTKRSPEHTFFGDGIVAHITFAQPICPQLQTLLYETASVTGPAFLGGTYVNIEGPSFSTQAESQTYHRAGFDVIGMTNLGEAKCAREAEICYATLAMVTDYDCWHESHAAVTAAMVMELLKKNISRAQQILLHTIEKMPHESSCKCQRTLKNAIVTPRAHWPEASLVRLQSILEKYLK
ncbi:MAG: S-methyl-5'-thioadenosine phosphorylase [Verrucomicrobiae bacterium]|nr:S-methyl-5'-thioadenosine phosphorylase [Verrucomicrobiae bacterium]